MCTHIQALSYWNTLTTSFWEVQGNIFTRNIGYIKPIMQSLQMSTFLRLKPKVLGKSVLTLTLGQIKGDN
jgi:hypothetical protein